jgi:hypothetical protein
MEACLRWMISDEALSFGAAQWGVTGSSLSQLPPAAYQGYLNMALGLHRKVAPESSFSRVHDELTRKLALHLSSHSLASFTTYPGETYPADLSTVIGSIALYQDATGDATYDSTVTAAMSEFKTTAIDPTSGLVYQSLHSNGFPKLPVPQLLTANCSF